MNRSFLDGSFGVVFGVLAGVACGASLGIILALACEWRKELMFLTVAAFASQGAIVGAVIGTGRDILSAIREASPRRGGPEADYREPDPPSP